MPAPIVVSFVAEGGAALLNTFKSIKQGAQELERTQTRTAQASVRSQQKAANDSRKELEREVKQREKIQERSAVMAGKVAEQQAKLEEKAEKAKTKMVEAEAKRREKIRERSAAMAGRIAEQESRAEARALEKAEREKTRVLNAEQKRRMAAERTFQRTNAFMAQGGASVANRATSVLGRGVRAGVGTVTGLAAGLGLAGGTMMVGSALSEAIDLQRQAALLSNLTSMPGFAPQSPDKLAAQARGVAGATGYKATDVMTAMHTVAEKAGGAPGLQAFQADIDDLSKTALAAGVEMKDMGAVYAAAFNAGVKPGKEMQQLMRDMVAMGKEGAIDFAELADQLAQMAGAGQLLSKSGPDMIRELVALSQFAVKQKVGPEETRTAIIHMIQEFGMKSDVLKKSGVNVIDEKTGLLRGPTDLLAEAMQAAYDPKRGIKFGKATKYGPGAMFSLLGERGAATANIMTKLFNEAGGGKAGADAIRATIGKMQSNTMSASQRDVEYANIMRTPAQQLAVAMEGFKAKVGELLPEFTALLPKLLAVAEGFARLAVWLGKNPVEGIGLIISASIVKEIAAAGLSAAVGGALKSALEALATTGPKALIPQMSGSVGSQLGALGVITLTATTVYLTGTQLIDQAQKEGEKAGLEKQKAYFEGQNLLSKAQHGGLTTSEKEQARKDAAILQGGPKGMSWDWTDWMLTAMTGGTWAGGKAGLSTMRAQSEETHSGASAKDQAAAAQALLKAAGDLSGAASKIASTSLSNPSNPARGGVPGGANSRP